MPNSRFMALMARINGEMAVADVPVAKWADTKALTDGDDDPLEVVMAVPAGKSTRGWNYKESALSSIVGEVNSVGLPGFLGHQKAENVATEFPQPVTHWVGAKMQGGTAYFRGLIDKSAPDLKRWIRGKAVSQVSIFGMPKLEQNTLTGETDVVDYKGMSIDWTPLNRAGMPTSVAAMSGEMDTIAEPADSSHEALREALRGAAYTKLNTTNDSRAYVSVNSVYDDSFIASYDAGSDTTKYYRFGYTKSPDGSGILLGEPTEVQRKESWEPVGEMKGVKSMNKELKALLDAGKITADELGAACGEMKITLPKADKESEEKTQESEFMKACGEMFGGKTGDDLMAAIKGASDAANKAAAKTSDSLIDDALKEKVSGEMAQNLVKKMMHLPENPTKEQISGEIDSLLADDTVKAVLAQAHTDKTPPAGTPSGEMSSDLFVTRKSAI